MLCGKVDINVNDWEKNTNVSKNLKRSPILRWFWEIIGSWTFEEKSRLLQFVTGSSRVPVQGFKGLTSNNGILCCFTLNGIPFKDGIHPYSHACFNCLDLPLYPTKELLDKNLKLIVNADVTGFTSH